MAIPFLVMVTGAAGAGKTTIGTWVAAQLNFPFINKDGIKETLYDVLGWKDRPWSRKLGAASSELIWYFVSAELQAGRSLVVESNFYPDFTNPKLILLKEKFNFKSIQIVCQADGDVLYARFKSRAISGDRHPGHVDYLNLAEAKAKLTSQLNHALDVCDYSLAIDTNDFEKVDLNKLLVELREIGVFQSI